MAAWSAGRIIQRRYQNAGFILTSNKSFIGWGEIFGDQVLATASLDRLSDHATTRRMEETQSIFP